MEKQKSTSCWESTKTSTSSVENFSHCPCCNEKSQLVSHVTVKHLVLENLQNLVTSSPYYICLNEDCNVVYFNKKYTHIFYKKDLSVPIWFKKDANPKYICYCNKVTEEMITNAILNKDAKNMKDIVELTGAMKNGKCLTKNPLGKCCGSTIQKIIDHTLKMKIK